MSVTRVGFEYFFTQGMPCCRAAFKIAMGVGNFRIHRVQQGFLNGDLILDTFHVGTKGSVGRHAMNWMMNYFSLHCEVMPTTGRLHLSDNFTRREKHILQNQKRDILSVQKNMLEIKMYLGGRTFSIIKKRLYNILVYDFSLTKTGHLRKATINMIKQKLPNVCGTGNHRKTRRVVHDPAEFGMYVDEDRALVDIEEEEESSQQYETESSASDDDGVDIDRQSCELH
ncbi:hypothetical protein KP509_33G003100 [Ceratopteris richardii]|uniref:Uncharacterized protein n=1 Tax=Ceratopteris richardii TaxID=49495 RepID=A0A8T2QMV4_CERRI|nr:hypothetical protein KP509_33G003100 [Ceratopteris richardii]